jgi:hypothetical protein
MKSDGSSRTVRRRGTKSGIRRAVQAATSGTIRRGRRVKPTRQRPVAPVPGFAVDAPVYLVQSAGKIPGVIAHSSLGGYQFRATASRHGVKRGELVMCLAWELEARKAR